MQIRNVVCALKIHLRECVWVCVGFGVCVGGRGRECGAAAAAVCEMLCLVKIASTIFL